MSIAKQAWFSRRRLQVLALFLLADTLTVAAAFGVALELRYDGQPPQWRVELFPVIAAVLSLLYLTGNLAFRMYWRGWRYARLYDAVALTQAVGIATFVAFLVDAALLWRPLPLTVIPMGGLLSLVGMGVARFREQIYQELVLLFARPTRSRILVVGAGRAGQWLARETLYTPALGYQPVCFVDDDPEKRGERLHGLPVAGTRHDIRRLIQDLRIDVVVLAISSLSVEARREIMAQCEGTPARIKIVPALDDLLAGGSATALFRDAHIEDLLGRPSVSFLERQPDETLRGTVLVTGAAGSIGSELSKQLAAAGPEKLILLDVDESGLFNLAAELRGVCAERGAELEMAILDVTNPRRVARVFDIYRPSAVFHVAAYKHVPLMEAQPEEAVITNVIGTLNVCRAAQASDCERLIFISTDKAVEPANVMGTTKLLGERIVQAFAADTGHVFCSVRFGNVLGSRGSVVPIFTKQIERGGPITVTHRDVSRFFMTIPEAANLIIEASSQATGGEIFILDMGEPLNIMELARRMIHLHGLRPDVDVQIKEVGLRPGEKLHEVLASQHELKASTNHPRVFRVMSSGLDAESRARLFDEVEKLHYLADAGATAKLKDALFDTTSGWLVNGEEPLPASESPRARRALPMAASSAS
jgi:FlaA1/EpsC-like NDP-sugar epimerase